MEKSRRDENKRRKKSREEVEMIGDMREKKRKKQRNSDIREEMFWLWRLWAYHPLLQKCGEEKRPIQRS